MCFFHSFPLCADRTLGKKNMAAVYHRSYVGDVAAVSPSTCPWKIAFPRPSHSRIACVGGRRWWSVAAWMARDDYSTITVIAETTPPHRYYVYGYRLFTAAIWRRLLPKRLDAAHSSLCRRNAENYLQQRWNNNDSCILKSIGAATRVRRTVSRSFAVLRQLRHLRPYVTNDCFRSLVVSFVHSRLDYTATS